MIFTRSSGVTRGRELKFITVVLLVCCSDVTGHPGRNLNRLYVPQVRTNYGRQSLYFRGYILWNNLSPSLYSAGSLAESYHDLNIIY